jgi:hypothetical protein
MNLLKRNKILERMVLFTSLSEANMEYNISTTANYRNTKFNIFAMQDWVSKRIQYFTLSVIKRFIYRRITKLYTMSLKYQIGR